MGNRLEKLQKMRDAGATYENPLVQHIKSRGIDAWRNSGVGGKLNRQLGDVLFIHPVAMTSGSIESQVASPTTCYENFSYASSKLTEYRGPDYANAYVHLGCYEVRGKPEAMIHMIMHASDLHEYLEKHGKISNDGKYFVIRPENLASYVTDFVSADTVPEVVAQWADRLKST